MTLAQSVFCDGAEMVGMRGGAGWRAVDNQGPGSKLDQYAVVALVSLVATATSACRRSMLSLLELFSGGGGC